MKKSIKTLLTMLIVATMFLGVISVSATEVVSGYGDVNMDNEVNSADLVCLTDYILEVLFSEVPEKTLFADVNNDKHIDLRDLVRLKKILVSDFSNVWVDTELGDQGSHDIF